jgi:protein disulfide-isomerase A6
MKIAYWNTETAGQPPRILGEIKGTPTIRMFKPRPKQEPGSNKAKLVLDYNGERKAVDLKRFADYQMPNYVEVISAPADLTKFQTKATKNGLPQVLLFPTKDKTMPLTKYLSTEFRRKLLLGEVKPSKTNKEVLEKFGVTDLPALIVLPVSEDGDGYGDPVVYQGSDYTKNKLHSFLGKYALQKMVVPPKNATTTKTTEEKTKTTPKEEEKTTPKEEL